MRTGGHVLDWEIKPSPFKIYPGIDPEPLPREFPRLERDALAALRVERAETPAPLDREQLAAVLFFSAGITKRRRYPGGGEVFFRAAPSTGALYQTEVYVVVGAAPGLASGVYHFGPGDFALRRLRAGDWRATLAAAAADEAVARAPATLVLTAIYWRNTWKYQARGYRHLFWDSGSMLANILAAAAALDLPARLVAGFADGEVNRLVGVDPVREAALALVPLGGPGAPAPPAGVPAPLSPEVIPLSAREVDYPLLRQAWADSTLTTGEEVAAWRGEAEPTGAVAARTLVALPPPAPAAGRALGETIVARGSTREFSGEPISAAELSTALHHATRGFPADFPAGLVDLCLNVHAVTGIAPGAYAYYPARHALELLRPGDFRGDSAFLCLDQRLGGLSSATVFFLADLGRVLARFGNRGYRLANLEAGLIGGRLYLAAYAQRFGATGLTFYDDEVVRFFSPHAAGRDALFVTALGRSVKPGAAAGLLPIRPTRR
ncbi:MAG: SagB/ThcOx family dehydrogenase [Candidatus Rokubacteria bacterium]|nr:SagB/ThcOx family dehydrogenase [Candidatus Rokubacteria bacterium]